MEDRTYECLAMVDDFIFFEKLVNASSNRKAKKNFEIEVRQICEDIETDFININIDVRVFKNRKVKNETNSRRNC